MEIGNLSSEVQNILDDSSFWSAYFNGSYAKEREHEECDRDTVVNTGNESRLKEQTRTGN